MRNTFMVFLILAIAFIAIGIGIRGLRAFVYVGIAFLIIGLLRSRRRNS